jgi:hypothetical protein
MPKSSANIKRWKKFRNFDTRSNPVESGKWVVRGMKALQELWKKGS